MTKKTDNRIAKDKQRLKDAGKDRLNNATKNRQVTSRSWYELKQVHIRSAQYMARMGEHLRKYLNPQVLAKIADNGREAEWNGLQKAIPAMMAPFAEQFEALLKRHEHKRNACTTLADMEAAYQLFEDYQKFDMDYYSVFQPHITTMNEIFNEALTQLLSGEAIDANTKSLPAAGAELEAPEQQTTNPVAATAAA